MDFVKNILNYIKEQGYTDTQICKVLKRNGSYLTDWKNGKSKPKVEDIIALSDLFKISVDTLIGRKKISIQDTHLVAYLDSLGAKNEIELNNKHFVEKLQQCYKDVLYTFNDQRKRAQEKGINLAIPSFKIFSDNVIFALPKNSDEYCPHYQTSLKLFIEIIAAFQFLALTSHKLPFRGCICYGNLTFENLCVSGKGLSDAVYGEENIAIFPRIIVQDKVVDKYKDILVKSKTQSFDLIKTDFDKLYFIDFLQYCIKGVSDIKPIYDFVTEKTKEHKKELKIFQKYGWLESYIETFCKENGIALDVPISVDNMDLAAQKKKSASPADDETDIT